MKKSFLSFPLTLCVVACSLFGCGKDGATPAKGTLSVYAYTLKKGYMDIRVDDMNATPTTLNTTLVSPYVPECGANTTATFRLSAGKHTLFFSNGVNVYNQEYTVIADSCQLILKNF